MDIKKIEKTVKELVVPIVDKHSYELVDVEFLKEGSNWYLRVYIDKPGKITVENCQTVSEELGMELDRVDPIQKSYILEVSSPGIERPLKTRRDFERYKGEIIEIGLFQPIDGNKVFEGDLLGLDGDNIVIKLKNGTKMNFKMKQISIAKRVFKF